MMKNSMLVRRPMYICPHHGETTVIGLTVYEPIHKDDDFALRLNRKVKLERNYCGECLADTLDLLGVENLKQETNTDAS